MRVDTTNAEQQLLALYDRVADTPDAIPRLRRLVLDLAVRGKLVEQDPDDEPAPELLERIAAEKGRLLEAGKIRKKAAQEPKMVAPVYELPTSWRWAPLGSIAHYDAGTKRESRSLDQSLWLLELEDVGKETGQLLNRLTVADRVPKSTKSEFQTGDILYGKLRPYLTKVLVADKPGYSTTEIVSVRPFIDVCPEYFALGLRRPDFVDYVTRLGQGTKMPRLRTEDAVVSPFPLPPIPEQHRIVAKVEELMALLDRLEATRTAAESTRDRLTAASLNRLTAPDTTPETFPTHARFALDALPALTVRADQIQLLRKTILSLAVRGKLVDQDPADEPASEFLKRITTEKARLVKAGKIRKPKSSASMLSEERSFSESSGWAWARLTEIGVTQTGVSPSSTNPELFGDFIPFVKPADLDGAAINCGGLGVSREGLDYSRVAPANSVMMVCIGATLGKVNVTDRDVCFNQQINSLTPYLDGMHDFLALALKSSDFQERAWARAGTGTLPIISKGKWELLPIPLPPLAEQHRIVSKVNELMGLCDRLEFAFITVDTTKQRLLETLLHETLTPVADREEEVA